MNTCSAFAPASISAFFSPYQGRDVNSTGALGLRFTLTKGIRAQVAPAKSTRIFVNGEEWEFALLHKVLKKFPPVQVQLQAQFPFGCGFGMSAGALLATLLASNELFSLALPRYEIAAIAHAAEVEAGTGRGDVASQITGGVTLSRSIGEPFAIERLRIEDRPVFIQVHGSLSTKSILKNAVLRRKVSRAGRAAVGEFSTLRRKAFSSGVKVAERFATESGLLQSVAVRQSVQYVRSRGGFASMIMLGEGVFSTIPFPGCQREAIGRRAAELL